MSRAEYIEREAAMQAVCKVCNIEFGDQQCEPCDCHMRDKLLMVPAADVAPVLHGRWKYGTRAAICTNCGFERNLDDNFGRAISCPNCGAKMDEKEDDDEQIN